MICAWISSAHWQQTSSLDYPTEHAWSDCAIESTSPSSSSIIIFLSLEQVRILLCLLWGPSSTCQVSPPQKKPHKQTKNQNPTPSPIINSQCVVMSQTVIQTFICGNNNYNKIIILVIVLVAVVHLVSPWYIMIDPSCLTGRKTSSVHQSWMNVRDWSRGPPRWPCG